MINVGAFLAPLVIGSIGDTGNPADFRTGFFVAGCFSLAPTALILLNYKNLIFNDLLYNAQSYKLSYIGLTNVILWFLLIIIFWLAYTMFPIMNPGSGGSYVQLVMALAGFLFSLIMIPIHLIRNFRSALKIAIGLMIVAIVCILYPLLRLPASSGMMLFAVAEVLVIPVIWSQIILTASPRFTGIIMSLLILLTVGINKIAGSLTLMAETGQFNAPPVLALLCLTIMMGLLILDHFQKKREQSLL